MEKTEFTEMVKWTIGANGCYGKRLFKFDTFSVGISYVADNIPLLYYVLKSPPSVILLVLSCHAFLL